MLTNNIISLIFALCSLVFALKSKNIYCKNSQNIFNYFSFNFAKYKAKERYKKCVYLPNVTMINAHITLHALFAPKLSIEQYYFTNVVMNTDMDIFHIATIIPLFLIKKS